MYDVLKLPLHAHVVLLPKVELRANHSGVYVLVGIVNIGNINFTWV